MEPKEEKENQQKDIILSANSITGDSIRDKYKDVEKDC